MTSIGRAPTTTPSRRRADSNGLDAVFEMFGELQEHWDDMSVVPDEFIEDGNTVVALGRVQVKVPFAHVWRIRDGKAGARADPRGHGGDGEGARRLVDVPAGQGRSPT